VGQSGWKDNPFCAAARRSTSFQNPATPNNPCLKVCPPAPALLNTLACKDITSEARKAIIHHKCLREQSWRRSDGIPVPGGRSAPNIELGATALRVKTKKASEGGALLNSNLIIID